MLPKDLQRFKIDGPNVAPQYIKATPTVTQALEQILDCFRFSPDDTYGMLQDSLEPLIQASTRHRLIKGIIHLLESRLQFEETLENDPMLLRQELFNKAAAINSNDFLKTSWRQIIFSEVAQAHGITPDKLETILYADLKDERRITAFDDLETEQLVAEYNLDLAKSLLLYAKNLTFTVELSSASKQSMRRLFQSMRFFNLLFESTQISDTFWQFSVDGPSAVLPQPQKYAASLAAFLPTLYAFKAWHATSSLDIDGKICTWQLKPDDFEPPIMHFHERIPEEALQLMTRIPQIQSSWQINKDTPILQFGPQCVWIPDFSMHNPNSGITAHVEVLGYWRGDYLNRRLEKLATYKPKNLILVLSDKLKIDKQALQNTGVHLVTFKRTPRPQDVIAAADHVIS